MAKRLLSTGKVAELCSVTPDAVLKWIKAGKLTAGRTAGGHFRVDPAELERLGLFPIKATYRFCWQHRAKDGVIDSACRTCLVHQSRAERCFELAALANAGPNSRTSCTESCEDCEFFLSMTRQAGD